MLIKKKKRVNNHEGVQRWSPRDTHGHLVVDPLVSEEFTDWPQCWPVHFTPGGPTALVMLLDRVNSLCVEVKVLQLLLRSTLHGDKLPLLTENRKAGQA